MSSLQPLTLAINDGALTAIIIVSLISSVMVVWSIVSAIRNVMITRAREETTRELAAYIAEGSIKPEDAERLINVRAKADLRDTLARWAAEGWISTKTVEKLLRDEPAPAGARPVHS